MIRLRASLIAPVLCAALAGTARGESLLPSGEKVVEASIGNHGTMYVRYSASDLASITVDVRRDNGSSHVYTWSREETTILIESGEGEELVALSDQPEEYAATLRTIRDLIAYASGPERYEWLTFGSTVVVPELNSLISRIDSALGAKTAEDVNCQLLAEDRGGMPLIVSGGAYGDLGAYSKTVSKVWVKKGYTLVLVSNPLFDTGHDVRLARVRGEERRASTELPLAAYDAGFSPLVEASEGTAYSLLGTLLEGQIQSFICRPDLR